MHNIIIDDHLYLHASIILLFKLDTFCLIIKK